MIFEKYSLENFAGSGKSSTFALAFGKTVSLTGWKGAVRKEFFDKIYINRK